MLEQLWFYTFLGIAEKARLMINQMRETQGIGWLGIHVFVLLGEGRGSSSTLVVIATVKVERYFNIGVGLFVS